MSEPVKRQLPRFLAWFTSDDLGAIVWFAFLALLVAIAARVALDYVL